MPTTPESNDRQPQTTNGNCYTFQKALPDLYVAADVYISRLVDNALKAHKDGQNDSADSNAASGAKQHSTPEKHIDHLVEHFEIGTTPQGRRLRKQLSRWLQAMRNTDRQGRNDLYNNFVERHSAELPIPTTDHLEKRLGLAREEFIRRVLAIAGSHEGDPTLDDLAKALEPPVVEPVAEE
jgi:hypothetical protein